MRRSARHAETLTELVALVALLVQHHRRAGERHSQSAIADKILKAVELPDLDPALSQLRAMAMTWELDGPVKAPRKRTGRVIVLDQPA